MTIHKTDVMAVRRVGQTYVVTPSETIRMIQNPDSLAILVYLLDQSQDWVIRRGQIMDRFNIGRDRYDHAMKHLKELGLAWIEVTRNAAGQILDRVLNVSASPVVESESPKVGKPTSREKPQVGESDHLTINNQKITNNNLDHFDEFWMSYPRKTNKAAAEKAWNRITKKPETLEKIRRDIGNRLAGMEWELSRKQFIPHPASYLNGRRWEDERLSVASSDPFDGVAL